MDDVEALLALLNSTPVVDGVPTDTLADDSTAPLRRIRDLLQAVVRDTEDPSVLASALDGVHRVPRLDHDGVTWTLMGADLPARMVLAWAAVQEA
ncbi:MAG: hypothetical protein ABIQ18_15855, partial [Umezawaea sp.]